MHPLLGHATLLHMSDPVPPEKLLRDTVREVALLRKSLHRLDSAVGGLLLTHPGRLYLRQFGLGIVRGIGSFLGATVVIGVIVYFVQKLSLIDRATDAIMQDILQRLPL